MFICFGESTTLIVLIYIDDILITGSTPTQVASFIAKLNSVFALRDLGRLTYFLGIKVSYHEDSIHLIQTKYVSDLLHELGFKGSVLPFYSRGSASPGLTAMFLCFGESTTLIALMYIDDILIIDNSPTQVASLVAKLNFVFVLRDLERLTYFLDIEVSYHEDSIHLNQTKYVFDLLHRTTMFDTKPVKTPGAVGHNLSKFDGEHMEDASHYRSIVGALQYLTITRPDIAFAVNKACQFMQQPLPEN
jgi:hypothetical protein